jgi:excisionase family DNA binding protein
MTNDIMTASELAEYLRLNEVTIYRLAQEGKLPGLKVGRQWRFKKEVIDELLRTGADMDAEPAQATAPAEQLP